MLYKSMQKLVSSIVAVVMLFSSFSWSVPVKYLRAPSEKGSSIDNALAVKEVEKPVRSEGIKEDIATQSSKALEKKVTETSDIYQHQALTYLVDLRDKMYMRAIGSGNIVLDGTAEVEGTADIVKKYAEKKGVVIPEGAFYPGHLVAEAIREHNATAAPGKKKGIIAVNTLSYGEILAHLQSAKELKAAIIIEIAKSQIGTALQSDMLVKYVKETAEEIGCDVPIVMHADHNQYGEDSFKQREILKGEYEKVKGKGSFKTIGFVKKGDKEVERELFDIIKDIEDIEILKKVKETLAKNTEKERKGIQDLNRREIKDGFTSIAVDGSTIVDLLAGEIILRHFEENGSKEEQLIVGLEKNFRLALRYGSEFLKLDPNSPEALKEKDRVKSEVREAITTRKESLKMTDEMMNTMLKERMADIENCFGAIQREAKERGLDPKKAVAAYDKIMMLEIEASVNGKLEEILNISEFKTTKEKIDIEKLRYLLLPTSNIQETIFQMGKMQELIEALAKADPQRFAHLLKWMGREIEGGHIDKKDEKGEYKLTHPWVGVAMMARMLLAGYYSDFVAKNNGSGHGTEFDKKNLVPKSQVTKISPYLTAEICRYLKTLAENDEIYALMVGLTNEDIAKIKETAKELLPFGSSEAQHGTSGSDLRELEVLVRGAGEIKVNIATIYQQINLNLYCLVHQGYSGQKLLDYVQAHGEELVEELHPNTRDEIIKISKEIAADPAKAQLKADDSIFTELLKRTYLLQVKKGKLNDKSSAEDIAVALAKETKRVYLDLDPRITAYARKRPSVTAKIGNIPEEIGFVYQTDPEKRKVQVKTLLAEYKKELENPGTGRIPQIAFITDPHADVNKFAQLISFALTRMCGVEIKLDPKISIEKQLNAQGLSLATIPGAIYLGGDLLDREKHGVKCFLLAQELVKKGNGHVYIIGNHDIWAGDNLIGFHVPIYEDYNLYGDKEAEELVKENGPQDFYWWTEKLAEYNDDQNALQKDIDLQKKELGINAQELREQLIKFYDANSKNWTDQQKYVWEDFIGYFAHISVPDPYVGLNGLGKTSPAWWQKLHLALQDGYKARSDLGAEKAELDRWQQAIALSAKIEKLVTERLETAQNEGKKWWYRVFSSIDNQAYLSAEWWAKDWSSHEGWGTAVIEEVNEMMKDPVWRARIMEVLPADLKEAMKTAPEVIDQKNYPKSPILQYLGRFYRENFNLLAMDPTGWVYTHSWLPVETSGVDKGNIVMTYQGKTYKGKEIWPLLTRLSELIKDPNKTFAETYEARTLVYRLYADYTTTIKPENEKQFIKDIGIAKIHNNLGIIGWFHGHNPQDKTKLPFLTSTEQGPFNVNADGGISKKFGKKGLVVIVGANGLQSFGFPEEDSVVIVEAPINTYEKDGVTKVIQNTGMPREQYLKIGIAAWEKELGITSDVATERMSRTISEMISAGNIPVIAAQIGDKKYTPAKAAEVLMLVTAYEATKEQKEQAARNLGTTLAEIENILNKFKGGTVPQPEVAAKDKEEIDASIKLVGSEQFAARKNLISNVVGIAHKAKRYGNDLALTILTLASLEKITGMKKMRAIELLAKILGDPQDYILEEVQQILGDQSLGGPSNASGAKERDLEVLGKKLIDKINTFFEPIKRKIEAARFADSSVMGAIGTPRVMVIYEDAIDAKKISVGVINAMAEGIKERGLEEIKIVVVGNRANLKDLSEKVTVVEDIKSSTDFNNCGDQYKVITSDEALATKFKTGKTILLPALKENEVILGAEVLIKTVDALVPTENSDLTEIALKMLQIMQLAGALDSTVDLAALANKIVTSQKIEVITLATDKYKEYLQALRLLEMS